MVCRKRRSDRWYQRLQIRRPAHRTDAGGAVLERNEPEPAVLKPVDGDIAAFPASAAVAPRVHEVSENCRTGVFPVLALDAEALRKNVAPRCILTGTVAPPCVVPNLRGAGWRPVSPLRARVPVDRGDACAHRARAPWRHEFRGQRIIEFRAAHTRRNAYGPAFVRAIRGAAETHGLVARTRLEFRGVLLYADLLQLVPRRGAAGSAC